MSSLRLTASTVISSPFWMRAIGPPTKASGDTWPTMKPWEPPEKRPSVMRATCLPRPAPMMALVGVSISRMPGPPLGPSYRMMMKSPFWILPCSNPFNISSSLSKTFALPVNLVPSLPVIFATAPSGHKLPRRILMLPVDCTHLSTVRTTLCFSKSRSGTLARFSAKVCPVTVMQSPWSHPSFKRYFMTAGVPPISWTSSIL
mmetsp:Transcript_50290/g.106880  ORF Transcript_50290/g.106880 Transcript_50290/m.106880 type:complete len:202 (+) Transcript_50290:215-820(+)